MKFNVWEEYLKGWAEKPQKPKDLPDTHYWCSGCWEVFEKEQTDEECKAEGNLHFPDENVEEMAMVCDDCWNRIMKLMNHEIGTSKKKEDYLE